VAASQAVDAGSIPAVHSAPRHLSPGRPGFALRSWASPKGRAAACQVAYAGSIPAAHSLSCFVLRASCRCRRASAAGRCVGICGHLLKVRMPGSQPANTGSSPVARAIFPATGRLLPVAFAGIVQGSRQRSFTPRIPVRIRLPVPPSFSRSTRPPGGAGGLQRRTAWVRFPAGSLRSLPPVLTDLRRRSSKPVGQVRLLAGGPRR
jgi:hypothetical protein